MDYRERISRSMRRNNRNRSTNKQHETIDFHDVDALYYRKWLWGIPKNLRKALRLNKTIFIDEKGNIMPLNEFNEANGTHFALEQICGEGYWGYLKTLSEKGHEVSGGENLAYDASEGLARALLSGDFSKLENFLSDDVEMIVYGNYTVSGFDAVLTYWKNWREKYVVAGKVHRFEVSHSNYSSNVCLVLDCDVVLFWVKDDRIRKMVFSARNFDGAKGLHDDLLNDYPFRYDYMKRHLAPLRDPESIVKENRLYCMKCGTPSESLDWYSAYVCPGVYGYQAQVSICPHCGKVVEFCTESRQRCLQPMVNKIYLMDEFSLQMDFKESKAIFAKNGISYHHALRKIFLLGNEDKGDLLNELGELRLDEDYHLGIRIASPEIDFTGDESNFFIYDCHNGKVTSEIFDHISVNPSPEAAWQVYLLMTSPTVMPVHWHGGYIVRKFIFDTSDLEEIEPIKDVDVSVLKENNMLLPDVTMRESKADGAVMADVYCCYWNEWKGLVREHAVVEMKDGRVVGFSVTGSICLYEYNCGRVY